MQVAAGGGGAGAGLQELAQHAAAGQEARTQAQEPASLVTVRWQLREIIHHPTQPVKVKP